MKVVHLITSLQTGGAETMLVRLLSSFKNSTSEHVVIYFKSGPNAALIKQSGIEAHHVQGLLSPYDPVGLKRLVSLCKALKPDIIDSSLWSANIASRFLARHLGIPLINQFHSNVRDHGTLRNTLEKLTITMPDHIIAVSHSARQALEEHIISKLSPRKQSLVNARISVIQNGIDHQAILAQGAIKPAHSMPNNAFVVGAVGRLVTIKRYDNLLKAFARARAQLDNLHLLIVGDGPERQNLEALSATLGINAHVTFAGSTPSAAPFYPLMNCFVLSSQSEGLSVAMLEALCFGLPVITTHDSKQHDVITHGVNGYLVAPSDNEALANALIEVARNKAATHAMKSANEALVANHFSLTKMSERYTHLYKKLTATQHSL
jgi:glycosyltransferase involved in cell wall biosynthesis